ncbi:MAG: hypothetical protein ACKVU1_07030 [bacterium]
MNLKSICRVVGGLALVTFLCAAAPTNTSAQPYQPKCEFDWVNVDCAVGHGAGFHGFQIVWNTFVNDCTGATANLFRKIGNGDWQLLQVDAQVGYIDPGVGFGGANSAYYYRLSLTCMCMGEIVTDWIEADPVYARDCN